MKQIADLGNSRASRINALAVAGVLALTLFSGTAWAGDGKAVMNWFELSMGLFGGLAIFLFGMEQMSEALKLVAGERMKMILQKLSSNRVAGVATGAVATAVVQSSSVTTVLVVGFITAGLMTLPQALGVILGANIGTTITAQIIAFKVTKFALLMIAAGFGVFFLARKQQIKQWGMLLLGLGLVFYGMSVMGDAMKPLRSFQPFLDLMISMENPLTGILVAALFTGLVQSSSATTGIVIVMATEGLVSLEAGIALALGANIGTCVTAALAAIGKPREAVRAAAAHLVFNIVGVLLVAPFVPQFAELVASLPAEAAANGSFVPREIANAHTVFNVGMTLVFLPFLGPLARALKRFIPDAEEKPATLTQHLDESLVRTPFAAISTARDELRHMAELVEGMLDKLPGAIFSANAQDIEALKAEEEKVTTLHRHIASYLSRVTTEQLAEDTADDLMAVMTASMALKNIAHNAAATVARASEADTRLYEDDKDTVALLEQYHQQVLKAFQQATEGFLADDWSLATETVMMKNAMAELEDELRGKNLEHLRTVSTTTDMVAYTHQMEIIEDLDRIYHHSLQIAQLVDTEDDNIHQLIA